MEELKDKPEEAGTEGEPGAGISLGKFRLPKRTVILGAVGLLVLSLVVAGILSYRSSVRQKEAVQAQKREQKAREAAARETEEQESTARAKELHRAHEEVLATPSALPGIFSSPAREAAPTPVLVEKPPAPAVAVANPQPRATEHQAPEPKKPEAKPEAKPTADKAAASPKTKAAEKEAPAEPSGVVAPTAAGGCALSGGKAEDYGKALGKCLEDFNRLEGRKPTNPSPPNKTD